MGIFGAKERLHEGEGRRAFRSNKSCENRARFFLWKGFFMDKQLTSVVVENLVDFYFYRRRDKRCVEISIFPGTVENFWEE